MELLIIALVVTGWMTKAVQDGRTDRAYAKKGQVSPRHQVRLARLEKAGRPVSPKGRGPLRNLAAEYWADAMLDLADRHRAKRAHRGAVGYDPDRPSVAQRFDTAVLDGIRRVQSSRGWDMTKAAAKTAGRKFVEPVGEKPADPSLLEEQVAEARGRAQRTDPDFYDQPETADPSTWRVPPGPNRTPTGDLYFGTDPADPNAVRQCNWCRGAGVVDGAPCEECRARQEIRNIDKEKKVFKPCPAAWSASTPCVHPDGDGHAGLCFSEPQDDGEGNLSTETWHRRTSWFTDDYDYDAGRFKADASPPPITDEADTAATPATGGTVMSEASNFETAVPALGELAAACQNLSDHVVGAESAADTFQSHVEEIDAAKQDVTAAIGSVQEQLAAKGVSGGAMDSITAAMEQVQAGDLMSAIDLIGQAKAQITDAKVAATEASGAAGQAQQDLIGQFGDAHNTIAADLGGDASFLDSGGGAGAGSASAGGFGGGSAGGPPPSTSDGWDGWGDDSAGSVTFGQRVPAATAATGGGGSGSSGTFRQTNTIGSMTAEKVTMGDNSPIN